MARLFAYTICLLFIAALTPVAADTGVYSATISALQERYADEIQAHSRYGLYAQRAQREGYPNIAHLFRSLAASEAVHASNFSRILKQLGVTAAAVTPKPAISTTRENLQYATRVEAAEIDNEYPAILEKLAAEHHAEAIENITYAWESEKQHRDLIIKIQDAATDWFGFLVDHIESEHSRYYVCHVCGSTLTEIPQQQCPVCSNPSEHYAEVPGFPDRDTTPEDSGLFNW